MADSIPLKVLVVDDDEGLLRLVQKTLRREGFSVARNTPYAGGYTTALYGRVASGCHALQIEINRALYLDEDKIVKKAGFELMRVRLMRAMQGLMAIPLSHLGHPDSLPEAAE